MLLPWHTLGIGLVAAALAAAAAWSVRDTQAEAQLSTLKAAHADQRAAWERQARESSETMRESERLARRVITKEAEDARTEVTAQAARAADLRTVAERLRQHIAALAAAGAAAPDGPAAAADGSHAAAGPGLVLAQLYAGADEEAVELAAAFDAARRAGLACQRIYAAVTAAAGLAGCAGDGSASRP